MSFDMYSPSTGMEPPHRIPAGMNLRRRPAYWVGWEWSTAERGRLQLPLGGDPPEEHTTRRAGHDNLEASLGHPVGHVELMGDHSAARA